MEERLKQLRAEYEEISKKLSQNLEAQSILKRKIYTKDTGLDVGSIVLVDKSKKGVVAELNIRYSSVEPTVRMYKKDGTLGKRLERVWSFQKIEKVNE